MSRIFNNLNLEKLTAYSKDWAKRFPCIKNISLLEPETKAKYKYYLAFTAPPIPSLSNDENKTLEKKFIEYGIGNELSPYTVEETTEGISEIKDFGPRTSELNLLKPFNIAFAESLYEPDIPTNEWIEDFDFYYSSIEDRDLREKAKIIFYHENIKGVVLADIYKDNSINNGYEKIKKEDWCIIKLNSEDTKIQHSVLIGQYINNPRIETLYDHAKHGTKTTLSHTKGNIQFNKKMNGLTHKTLCISENSELKWKDITATFLGEDELLFQFKQDRATRRYNQMGFEDGRMKNSGDKPIFAWHILLKASNNGGTIPADISDNRKMVEKHAQVIRTNFKALFPNIPENPIPFYKKDRFYKLAFLLKPPHK